MAFKVYKVYYLVHGGKVSMGPAPHLGNTVDLALMAKLLSGCMRAGLMLASSLATL